MANTFRALLKAGAYDSDDHTVELMIDNEKYHIIQKARGFLADADPYAYSVELWLGVYVYEGWFLEGDSDSCEWTTEPEDLARFDEKYDADSGLSSRTEMLVVCDDGVYVTYTIKHVDSVSWESVKIPHSEIDAHFRA